MYYKCHKTNLNRSGAYIDSPDWVKNKKIDPISKKDNNCFPYAVTVPLNHEEMKIISLKNNKINAFLSEKYNWKRIEKNNLNVAVNVLYAKKRKNIYTTYVSKYNSNREKTSHYFNNSKW